MKKLIASFFLLFIAVKAFPADNAFDTFKNANKYYEASDYQKAIAEYGKLVEAGQVNAAVYYNLGNAFYRNREPGFAILNYEKALRLAPRDRDIVENLNFLRKTVQEPELSFIETLLNGFLNLLGLNALTLLCSFIYFCLVTGIIIYLYRKSALLLIINSALLCVLIVAGSWLYLKIQNEAVTRWAIITKGPVEIRNGPAANNTVAFNLPEGRKVYILSEKDDWAAIGLKSEGLTGWIEKSCLSEI
jgi:tetratricopeptide (TPR) repeat protein